MHGHILCGGGFNTRFITSEAKALLELKQGLIKDPSNLLSSWTLGKDCCSWKGVGCNTTTGHVISLNLHSSNSLDKLQGPLSSSLQQLPYLTYLNLSGNDFMQSRIPSFLGTMQNLKHLDLSHANFKGSLIDNLGNLSLLESLDLSGNGFYVNSLKWLHGFSSLKILDLSGIDLSSCKNDWFHDISIILHSLETLRLSGCRLHKLPKSPRPELICDPLITLDLSINYFNSTIPDWLFENCHHLQYLNLSTNTLQGPIPHSIESVTTLAILDMSNNMLNGSIPSTFGQLKRCGQDFSQKFKLKTLDLSHNNFSCPLPRLPPNSRILDLSNNLFYGTISQICEMLSVNNSLGTLDLSYNNLIGVIPNCWTNGTNMITLNLAKNNFTGLIPDSFGCLANLHMLIMYNNNLFGKIPNTLKNCPMMTLLDLQSNRFSGHIPSWIGRDMPILKALILGRNSFDGNIPKTLCQLKSLQILDLSQNQLRGQIPRCVFPAMATQESVNEKSYMEFLTIKESLSIYQSERGTPILITWKTIDNRCFKNYIHILKLIDLSSNFLTKSIPDEIGKLVELISLNLSRNQLVGSIPSNIGEMRNLESLDLSKNHLSCAIPTSMANMEFLSYLNLSYNTLSGKIPIGTQLQLFNASIFGGNPHLCGEPLDKACPRKSPFKDAHCSHGEEHENDSNDEDTGMGMEINPFYISMGIGFSTGFWVFWGSLILIASWRHAYFRFLSNMNDRIYVTVVVAYNKLRRKLHAQQPPM
ncbi:endo-1,4-beta-xylanase [Trifolium repens]|nr:endo-1,4-beta-xylanase [Trifolium repens]